MNAVLESTTPAALEPPPKFVIPEMLKAIRPRINTSYPYIKRLHAQWLYENYGKPEPGSLHGAIERMDSLYDASVFPDGIPERVAHHASILTLIFQCDDLTTSDPEQCAKIIAEDPDAHDARVMEGLWQTIRQHAPSDATSACAAAGPAGCTTSRSRRNFATTGPTRTWRASSRCA
ncbi:hypothetical protein [Variovorax boronicumulans]|uniref:hypothetical protein n=1 Tax=Variovorax boronicumulans TaxID=436515 RepID=UPI000784FB5E|nr:hypothetical protein [Variovorax boronicumulans]